MKDLTIILSIIFIFLLKNVSYSQLITGKIDDNGTPIEFANVILKSTSDSSMVRFQYSDQLGKFQFTDIQKGNYFIHISYLGYRDYISTPFILQDSFVMDDIHLIQVDSELDEITITAKKPLVEVQADKLVLNIANSILSSGDDALNLLRKAPGVLVDNNDNISLLGKSGAVIYLDGKRTVLSNEDLARMLKNMSSDDIERIEIITNPSAKFDAAGSAGIINIVRKKNKKRGFNSTYSGTYRRSTVDSYLTNLNIGFQNSKWDISNYSNAYNTKSTNWNHFTRIQNTKGIITNSSREHLSEGFGDRFRIDYQISDKHSIGSKVSYNKNRYQLGNARSRTSLYDQSLTQIDSILINDNQMNQSKYEDLALNLNYLYQGSQEKMLLINLNSAVYYLSEKSFAPNIFQKTNRQN